MNILDENFLDEQRLLLRHWRIPVRQIGRDTAHKGIQDDLILPFLLQLRRPTLFTRDRGFYQVGFCHRGYCLIVLDVTADLSAEYTRRLLRHPRFNTQAKRMGAVIRVSATGLTVWRRHAATEERLSWTT